MFNNTTIKDFINIAFTSIVTIIVLLFPSCSNVLKMYDSSNVKNTNDPIVIDKSLSGFIEIENDSLYVYEYSCIINNYIENAIEMRFQNNSKSWSTWETFLPAKKWILEVPHSYETVRNNIINAQFRDESGNTIVRSSSVFVLERIIAHNGFQNDFFGNSVSLSSNGTTAIISAYGYDHDRLYEYDNQGSVYIASWDGGSWNTEHIFIRYGTEGDEFGNSVSISGNGRTAVVGAWKDDGYDNGYQDNQGAAYIFEKSGSTWKVIKKIFDGESGHSGALFGKSVSVSSDSNTIAVGSHHYDSNRGAVYVFRRNQNGKNHWGLHSKILVSNSQENDFLGTSVSVSGDGNRIVAGANGKNSNRGIVFVFEWNGVSWNENIIDQINLVPDDNFGISTSISSDGNVIAIGAYGRSNYRGSVFVFQNNGFHWSQREGEIIPIDGSNYDQFGRNVVLSGNGDVLSVSAHMSDLDSNDQNEGLIYVYSWKDSIYNMKHKLFSQDSYPQDNLGSGMSMSSDGSIVLAGTKNKTIESKVNQGSVYIFRELF